MTKKERLVMSYLCSKCQKKKTCLIPPQEITMALSKKFILSTAEIDEIMVQLSNENYIDFVVTERSGEYMYCVTLKKCGISYNSDQKREKKQLGILILRSIFLATISFVFGIILKAIFGTQ